MAEAGGLDIVSAVRCEGERGELQTKYIRFNEGHAKDVPHRVS